MANTWWAEAGLSTFGPDWYKSKANLLKLSRMEGRRSRGMFNPRAVRSVRRVHGPTASFKIDASRFDRHLRRLPAKMAARIQRKGLRKGLVHWRNVLKVFFSRHRSDKFQPHTANHVAVVSRVYRRSGGFLVWGGVGIRKGSANKAQLKRAARATIAHGAGQDFRAAERDARQLLLPGWRTHFLEARGKTRNTPGTYYFPKAFALGRRTVYRKMAGEIRRLVREMQT